MPTRTDVLTLDALRLQRITLYRYRRGLLFDICVASLAGDKPALANLAHRWHRISATIKVLNRWMMELTNVI